MFSSFFPTLYILLKFLVAHDHVSNMRLHSRLFIEMIEVSLQLGFANANEFHFDFSVTK